MALKSVFKCGECGDIHDEEDDAVECCFPGVTEGFLCPVCQGFFIDEEAALACHDTDEDFVPPPTAAELEAAGQMRLLP